MVADADQDGEEQGIPERGLHAAMPTKCEWHVVAEGTQVIIA